MSVHRKNLKAVLIASAGVAMFTVSARVQAQSTIRYTRVYGGDTGYCQNSDTIVTIATERPRPYRRVYVEPAYRNSRVVVTYNKPTYSAPVYHDDGAEYVDYPSQLHLNYRYVNPRYYSDGGHYSGHHGHRVRHFLHHIGRGLHRLGHFANSGHHHGFNHHHGFGNHFRHSFHGRRHGGFFHHSHR